MCLLLSIMAPETARSPLESTVASLGRQELRLDVLPPLQGKRGTLSGVISEAGGCACSLLADDATWDTPYWAMRHEILAPLARLVEAVGVAATEGFTFQALWVGEIPTDQLVSLNELLALVEAGQIGTRTRYTVRATR